MTSGTPEVMKVSENDHELSLRGPVREIHKLDVNGNINGDLVKTLKVGDYVDLLCDTATFIVIRKDS